MTGAPLPVLWEVTRAALHCGVKLDTLDMPYYDTWRNPTEFYKALKAHPDFRGKTLPARCDGAAWEAAFSSFQHHGHSVTLVIEASYNYEKNGPLYNLALEPLKLEHSHRLGRRFGADRFLEVLIPSPTSKDNPKVLKRGHTTDELIRLLAQSEHILFGRIWRSFFTGDKTEKAIEKRESSMGPQTKNNYRERLYFFAVDGDPFKHGILCGIPPKEEATSIACRTKMSLVDLLEWAITPSHEYNQEQTTLKLFSRISLSMSPSPSMFLGSCTHPSTLIRPKQDHANRCVEETPDQRNER